jgi:hypothetical protein
MKTTITLDRNEAVARVAYQFSDVIAATEERLMSREAGRRRSSRRSGTG